ncbi:hypothetical protein GCK32_003154 [Trichostrongylus colubriformis]|uniref:Uncharacterized protein n=1 Tax=Trichostrongylus colubriformis TaxID=6319 RepID=A0AAN8G0R7_TRICO
MTKKANIQPIILQLEVGDKFTPYMNERIEHLKEVYNSLDSTSEKTFLNGVMQLALRQVAGQYPAKQIGATIQAQYQGLSLSDCQALNAKFHLDEIFGNCTGH